MKSLEGYFDTLATTAVNKKSVLDKLVANNTKLAATNEDLVAIVKKLTNEIKNLERETSRLKKTHCNKEGYHAADACFELVKNKDKRPTGWKILF